MSESPFGKMAVVWENVLMISIVYNFATTCFFLGLPGFPSSVWLYLEVLTEVAMVVDILIRYCVLNILIKSTFKKIGPWRQINMLKNKQDERPLVMILTICSSVPSSIILYSSVDITMHSQIWLAVIRVVKLYRLRQLNLYFDVRDIRSKKDSFIRTFEATIYILMVTHFLACLWLFIVRVDPQQDLTWFKLVQYDQYEVSMVQKYVDSALFVVSSMTGLGFAYIYPRTRLEYVMQSLIMVCGVSLYANFFAFFTVTIYNRNKKMIENMLRYEESKELGVLRNFPGEIRAHSRNYYNNLRLKFDQIAETYQIVQQLPFNLQSEMSLFINSDFIQKVNFFQFADPTFILAISKCLVPEIALEDCCIVQRGEVASKMYFIKSGIVQVIATDNKTSIAFMSEGTYFGEIGVLLTQKRSCTIKARSCTSLFSIGKDDLIEILSRYPLIYKYLKAVGKQRLETTHPSDISGEQDNGFLDAYRTFMDQQMHSRLGSSQNHYFTIYNSQTDLASSTSQVTAQNRFARGKTIIREKYGIQWFFRDQKLAFNQFLIMPFSKLFNVWSTLFCIVFIYNLLYIPFSIGLRYDIPHQYIAIDIVAMSLTLVDSILRPFLAINKNLDTMKERDQVIINYFKRKFPLDALGTIPFDYLVSIIEDQSGAHRYFRLLRLFKVYRLSEISGLILRYTQINVLVYRLIVLFFAYALVAHVFNCALLYFGMWEWDQNRRFDGKTLIGWLQQSSSVDLPKPDQQTVWELYANLVVLAFCYMGSIVYGDIIPFTVSEETISLIEMLIGRVFIAFLFAEMSNYVQYQYQAYNNHINERDVVLKWIQINGIQSELKDRIIQYFEIKWTNNKGIKEEELIEDLPDSLRKDVKNFIYEDLIHNCDVFPKEDHGAITTIANMLQRVLIPKNEFIIKQGELAADMCFIIKGTVRVVTSEGQTLATLSKYKHFGEMALISEHVTLRSTSIVADSNVELAVLSKDDFKIICSHYPFFKTRMQEIIDMRTKDSQKKGFQINAAQTPTQVTFENIETNEDLLPTKQKGEITIQRKPQGRQMQLSIIEEESKKGDTIFEEIATLQSKSNIKRMNSKVFLEDINNEAGRQLSLGLQEEELGDRVQVLTKKYNSAPLDEEALQQVPQRISLNRTKTILSRRDGDQKQDLEIIIDEEEDNGEKLCLDPENQEYNHQTQRKLIDTPLPPPIDIESLKSSSRRSNDIRDEDINYENSMVQTATDKQGKLVPQVRFEMQSISMKDIDQNSQQNDLVKDKNQNFLNNPFKINPQTKENENKNNKDAKLKNQVRFSSSISNFQDYLQQYKENMGTKKATFFQMFAFYAFKYMLIFPISIYNMIFIPVQLGFSIPFKGWYLFMEILTIISFIVDLYLILKHFKFVRSLQLAQSINQVAPENSEESNSSLQHESALYDKDDIIKKIWHLKIDAVTSLISIVPFSLIFQHYNSPLFIINFLRVLRLIKLLPVYRVLQYFKKFSPNLIRLFEIISAYYLVAHISAGVMLSIGLANGTDISNTWLNKVPVPLPKGVSKQTSSEGLSWQTLYIHAIYFTSNTISHVAIGDLTSVTLEERLLNAFMIWIFTFFYAMLFANISSIFTHGNSFLDFNERYQRVLSAIPTQKLSPEVRDKIDTYYEYLWATNHGRDEVKEVFKALPRQMMYDAMRERFAESFESSIIFKEAADLTKMDLRIVNSFIEQMEIRVYMPRDFIIKAGSDDSNLYFILDGNALMFGIDDNLIGILSSGSHYSCEVNNNQLYMGKQILHLVSLSITTVGVVSKSNAELLFQAFPDWKNLILKLNQFILQKAKNNLDVYKSMQQKKDHQKNHDELGNDNYMQIIQDHLAFSDNINHYKKIIAKLDIPQNHYIYDSSSQEYKKMNILNQQMVHLQNNSLIRAQRSPCKKMAKRTSSQSILQFNLAQNQIIASEESNQGQGTVTQQKRFIWLRLNFPRWRLFVEFIQLINLIYISFAVTFSIAYINQYDVKFTIIESISIAIQLIFIFTKFRTPVIYIGGSTMKFKHVFMHYLKHGLVTDLLGALPLNLIFCWILKVQGQGILIGIVRLTRLAAIARINELYEKFEIHLKDYSVKLVSAKSFLIFYFAWHTTSGLWYFINIMEEDLFPLTWAKQFKMTERPIGERYLMSMYYVIKIVTGLGQSDMIAYNDLERICFIMIINLGDAVFAMTFGLIAQIQMHISENSHFQQYVQKMKEVETFLNFVQAQSQQKKRIEQYFSYENYLKNKKHIHCKSDLEGSLPFSVIREVIYEIQKETLEPMFKNFQSENLIRELSFAMQTAIYMAGDYIITKGQEGEEMYFILEGQVSVIGDYGTVIKTLQKNAYFGEVAIFMKIKRTANVQAKTPCILGILKRADIEQILKNYPKVAAEFIKEANRRMKEMEKMFDDKSMTSKMTPNQSFGTDKDFMHDTRDLGYSLPDNVDQSFVEALQHKIQNIVETQSNYTDFTNRTLMKKMKMKAAQVQGMADFAKNEKKKLEKKKSTLKNCVSMNNLENYAPTFAVDFNQDSSPAFGKSELFISEDNSPQTFFYKNPKSENLSPTQFNKAMKPTNVINEEDIHDIDIISRESDMKSQQSISSSSEPEILASFKDKKQISKPQISNSSGANENFEIQIKEIDSSFDNIKPRLVNQIETEIQLNEDRKFVMSPLSAKNEKFNIKIEAEEVKQSIVEMKEPELAPKMKSKTNSSNMISYRSRRSESGHFAQENQNLMQLNARRQSAKLMNPSQQQDLLGSEPRNHQDKLKKLSKEYQDLLFKHVLSTIQGDDEAEDDYQSIDDISGGTINQTPHKFHREGTTIRVKPVKYKKPKRRLSKIQMGRNLMLNENSGLQLQWMVGGNQSEISSNFML